MKSHFRKGHPPLGFEDSDRKQVATFYDTSYLMFRIHSLGNNEFHYGLWTPHTRTSSEASRNTTQFVASCLELQKQDIVLDAGCGMGGTTVYLAERFGCYISGTTISKVQLKGAQNAALKSPARNRLAFFLEDYRQTHFEDNSFSKVLAIESVCYSSIKSDFLREAFRLLDRGGKLAVCDAFLTKIELEQNEKYYYEKFIHGFAIPNLVTKQDFMVDLQKTGFKNIEFFDKSREVKKSSERIYKESLLVYPIGWLLRKIRLIPQSMYDLLVGGIYQKKFGDTERLVYGVFVAEKI
jgi:tocopherol O-methyltransferase